MSRAAAAAAYKDGPLPSGCPPSDAPFAEDAVFLRLVTTNPPAAADFRSGHAEGKKKPKKCDDCRWMACSVWKVGTPRERLADLAKLPNLSDKKFVAFINVKASYGHMMPHDTDANHVSFWMYASFKPEGAVSKTEPL